MEPLLFLSMQVLAAPGSCVCPWVCKSSLSTGRKNAGKAGRWWHGHQAKEL